MWDKTEFSERLKGLDITEAARIVLSEKERLERLNKRPKPNKGQRAAFGHYTYEGDIQFLDNLHMILTTGYGKKSADVDKELIHSIIDNLK